MYLCHTHLCSIATLDTRFLIVPIARSAKPQAFGCPGVLNTGEIFKRVKNSRVRAERKLLPLSLDIIVPEAIPVIMNRLISASSQTFYSTQ